VQSACVVNLVDEGWADAGGDDGTRAEVLGDPLHRGELRGRDHQASCLAAQARLDLEFPRGVDAVVASNLGRYGR
jgi:hypothetical protein